MKNFIIALSTLLVSLSAFADQPCEPEFYTAGMQLIKDHFRLIYKTEAKKDKNFKAYDFKDADGDEAVKYLFNPKNGKRSDRLRKNGETHVLANFDENGDYTGDAHSQSLKSGDEVVYVTINGTSYPVAVIRDCWYLPIMDDISDAPAPAPKETTKDGGLQEENEKLREKLAFLENNGGSGKTDATVEKKDGNTFITVNVLGGDSKAINGDVNGGGGSSGDGEVIKYVIVNADGGYTEVPDDQIQTVLQAQRGRSWRTVNGVRYMAGQNSALVSYTQQAGCTNCFPLSRNGRPLSSNADIATAVGVWVQPVMAPLYNRMWDYFLGGVGGRSSGGGGIYRPIGGGGREWTTGGRAPWSGF